MALQDSLFSMLAASASDAIVANLRTLRREVTELYREVVLGEEPDAKRKTRR